MGEISGEETQWQPEPQLIEFEARGPEEFTVLGGEISGYFRIQNGVLFFGEGGDWDILRHGMLVQIDEDFEFEWVSDVLKPWLDGITISASALTKKRMARELMPKWT